MIFKSVRDLSELTLGEAEELRKAGASLRMTPEGKIVIDNVKMESFSVKEEKQGGQDVEGNAG